MDKSMLGDLGSLPSEDHSRMSNMIDQLQIRDSLRMYNAFVERYFSDCVDSFRRKTLDKQGRLVPATLFTATLGSHARVARLHEAMRLCPSSLA
ncbi:Tim10/DDP family zinc finger [Cynara cardunculus var. scolymus]|uniref:Tim10/DDP family zinc finger n=1 Tax=Cynara cardunculus var. scolymus TaxID=59895 RepID=A0A103YMQ9_CYNCS|nr:Tim10/DDP family zinc finger [Cynara cardunculus var. scolymus]